MVSVKATQQLKNEHEGVNLMLDILEEISRRLEKSEQVDPQHLAQILEFLQVFVDKCHHSKEEELLFPAMEEVGIPKERGPIGMMLLDHDQGRGYIKGLKEAIGRYEVGDEKSGAAIVENAQNYISLLRAHIDKENNILYMLADDLLPATKQDEMIKDFAKIEERIGSGKHEQFHKLLDDLAEIYLED